MWSRREDGQWNFGEKERVLAPRVITVAAGEALFGELSRAGLPCASYPLAPQPGADLAYLTGNELKVGWERKELGNLISSMNSGELADQLRRLITNYDIPILLIEKFPSYKFDQRIMASKYSGIGAKRFWLEMADWQEAGVTLQITKDILDSARRVAHLFEHHRKTTRSTTSRVYVPRPAGDGPHPFCWIAGIGEVLEGRILEAAGGVPGDAVKWPVEVLVGIEGVRRTVAERFVRAWRGE